MHRQLSINDESKKGSRENTMGGRNAVDMFSFNINGGTQTASGSEVTESLDYRTLRQRTNYNTCEQKIDKVKNTRDIQYLMQKNKCPKRPRHCFISKNKRNNFLKSQKISMPDHKKDMVVR